MNGIKRVSILGCPFDAISFSETAERIRHAVLEKSPMHIAVGNVDMVMRVRKDPWYARIWWDSDLVIADGVPVTWAASFLGTPLKGRVSGTDIVLECARISAETGCTVACIGGIESITRKAAREMERRYPGARVAAIPTPFPLDETANEKLVGDIRDSGAAIVLVALGAPRQERWIRAHLKRSGCAVGIGIGSAFDIISGAQPRAPEWMKDNGLEWLHRLRLEPRRLARRYLIDDAPFVYLLLRELITTNTSRKGLAHAE